MFIFARDEMNKWNEVQIQLLEIIKLSIGAEVGGYENGERLVNEPIDDDDKMNNSSINTFMLGFHTKCIFQSTAIAPV